MPERLTPEQLARFRADYHQCGVTIVPLLDEVDALTAERDEAAKRAEYLADAIRTHRAQKADDRCWMDDFDLYSALDDGVTPDNRVGDKEAMLANCKRFVETRCAGGKWTNYAELEADVARLQRQVEGHCERIVKQSELLSRRAEKGSEALTAERDRLAVAIRGALARLEPAGETCLCRDGSQLDAAMVRAGLRHALDTLAAEGGGESRTVEWLLRELMARLREEG
jgi:hypothetical protein